MAFGAPVALLFALPGSLALVIGSPHFHPFTVELSTQKTMLCMPLVLLSVLVSPTAAVMGLAAATAPPVTVAVNLPFT